MPISSQTEFRRVKFLMTQWLGALAIHSLMTAASAWASGATLASYLRSINDDVIEASYLCRAQNGDQVLLGHTRNFGPNVYSGHTLIGRDDRERIFVAVGNADQSLKTEGSCESSMPSDELFRLGLCASPTDTPNDQTLTVRHTHQGFDKILTLELPQGVSVQILNPQSSCRSVTTQAVLVGN